jgi:hypothetical protein
MAAHLCVLGQPRLVPQVADWLQVLVTRCCSCRRLDAVAVHINAKLAAIVVHTC